MSAHTTCGRCAQLRASVAQIEAEIKHCLRRAEQRPGSPGAKGNLSRVRDMQGRLRVEREEIKAHLAGVSA